MVVDTGQLWLGLPRWEFAVPQNLIAKTRWHIFDSSTFDNHSPSFTVHMLIHIAIANIIPLDLLTTSAIRVEPRGTRSVFPRRVTPMPNPMAVREEVSSRHVLCDCLADGPYLATRKA
jgi:hypothetical protein